MGMWRANPKNSRGVRCCALVSVAIATCLVLSIKFVRVLNPVESLVALREGRLRMDGMVTSTTSSFRGSLPSQRLAVVVPAHSGDLYRALASLSKWPTKCSPVTRAHVDLVLYKAEAEDELSFGALRLLENTAGICFANTKIVHGALTKEVRIKLCVLCHRNLFLPPPGSLRSALSTLQDHHPHRLPAYYSCRAGCSEYILHLYGLKEFMLVLPSDTQPTPLAIPIKTHFRSGHSSQSLTR